MPERNRTKDILIGVMVIAMIVISILVVYLINHKVSLVLGTVLQTQTAQLAQSHAVLGTVEKVSGQEITLKDFRKSMTAAPSSVSQSARMIVLINQSTIIQRLSYKDQATIAKENDDFIKNIQKIQAQSPSIPPTPPEPFTLEKISLSDIHDGDVLIASSAEDISALTTFIATKIEVQNKL